MHAEITWDTPEELRAKHHRSPEDKPRLHVVWEVNEMVEVQQMIDRAYGTLEPREWPVWVKEFEKKVRELGAK
jgi:hypothetical protein